MEVNLLINKITFPNNINEYNILGGVLTYLKQKKIKNYRFDFGKTLTICLMILEIIELIEDSKGICKAGNYAIRMMNWLVRDVHVNNINYYDLVGTALTYMKGRKFIYHKRSFCTYK